MTTDQLRKKFLDFFAAKNHKIYPSDSLIPKGDPTLLFTSAGMNQFKQQFLGRAIEFSRCVSVQKCLRTDDLDKVGKTTSHHTFFEMLGNFSFGDYFKEEAIAMAWEFVTRELELSPEQLWVSVYYEDDESFKIWRDKIGIPEQRIVKLGARENFWPANAPQEGPDGPCGPCSEIFYDRGEEFTCGKPECNLTDGCGRFVETWNLVFTQFNRQGKDKLAPLPKKNIDTGMGLERMAAVLQKAPNNFEIDIFKPIVTEIVRLSPIGYEQLSPTQYSSRNAIADHIRAVVMAVGEGIVPSNDERGYVIRKLIRRAVWHGRSMGIERPYLYKIVPVVASVMKSAYPEASKKRENIAQIVLAEEKRFHKTLARAMVFAEDMVAKLKAKKQSRVPGEAAFKLYDTYGLPREMLRILLDTHGLELDEQGFEHELGLQRRASRQASRMETGVFAATLASKFNLKPTKFVGEKRYSLETKISALFDQNDNPIKKAQQGQPVKVVLQNSPFYAESGGQISDTGMLKAKNAEIEVVDAQKSDGTIVHYGNLLRGTIKVGEHVEAVIDVARRKRIACNHTATHLLQAALRKVLGEHVRQAGSWVGPDKLRFDFTHFKALDQRQLKRVEELVNSHIKEDKKADILNTSFEQSQKLGALSLFGEKYQEKVRLIKIGDASLELCGGTHIGSTVEISLFKIVNESSVASGIRRIEAVTGKRAKESIQDKADQIKEFAQTFGGPQELLPERIERFLNQIKELDRRLEHIRINDFKSRIDEIIKDAREVNGVKVVAREVKSVDARLLRFMADLLKQKLETAVIVLASSAEDQKVLIVCTLSADLGAQGLDAVKIVRELAKEVNGSGGGRPDFAQAGGNNPAGIAQALARVAEIVKKELGG